ncbi:MAG: hypothetical protein QM642_05885 [Edaphocola sp.]
MPARKIRFFYQKVLNVKSNQLLPYKIKEITENKTTNFNDKPIKKDITDQNNHFAFRKNGYTNQVFQNHLIKIKENKNKPTHRYAF